MTKLIVEKPIIGKKTGVGQAFDQFLSNTKLPINEWCREQKRLSADKKF